jgi:Trp operon repressor
VTPLSRWKLVAEDEKNIVRVLIKELTKITSEQEMEIFVQTLFTKTERLMIAKRIFAFVLIDQNMESMEIARKLHFTRATVERLRMIYEHLDEVKIPVKKLVRQFEASELLEDLLKSFLNYAIPAAFGRIPRKVL